MASICCATDTVILRYLSEISILATMILRCLLLETYNEEKWHFGTRSPENPAFINPDPWN